jgi:hypothetical protein
MFSIWQRYFRNRPISLSRSRRRPLHRPRLELLEDRCLLSGTVTITSIQGPSTTSAAVPVATEGALASPSLNAIFTDTNASSPAALTVTVNYGDGTAVSSNQAGPNFDPNLLITQIGGSLGTTYTVTDTHTFPEESGSTVPPFAFTATLTVTENSKAANTDTTTTQAEVLDAALAPGNPITAGSPTQFTGGDAGNATSASAALANFKAAIGGSKNTVAAPQTSGFRAINWDAVKVDGTDAVAGANSTVVITPGHTVGIPLNRFQGQGVYFGAIYAVTNDGFVDTNPNVGSPNPVLFPAFSAPNTFAMFNDNGIDFKFVAPASPFTPPVSAVSRGFGAIFLNVQQPGTTIQYFHGSTVLGTLNVPTNPTAGAAVFAGELFANPIVTNVLLTLGNGVIFKFDGTTVTAGGVNSATTNLVATDDFVYAEPQPAANGFPIVSGAQGALNAQVAVNATVGVPFTGVVATFSDSDPSGNAKDFTATINWGDGHFSNGTITANSSGGFDVSGTNTYSVPITRPINVDIADFGGGPGLGGSQPTLSVNNTALVSAGDQNHRFVAQVYLDLLDRVVDPSGLQYWGGLLDAGTLNRAQVVQGIELSLEYRIVEVNSAYSQILGRAADPTGLSAFVQALQNGATLEQVKADLAGSPEFASDAQAQDTTAGLSTNNQKFVDFLFQKVLSRPADASGLSTFTTELANGTSTAAVALQVLTSPEAYSDLINSFYLQFLKRPADSAGLAAFTQDLLGGATDEGIIVGIVASDEYFARV